MTATDPASTLDAAEILASRRRHLGPSLSLAYRTPLHIVRGAGAYLYDADGRAYLDCVNNVAHVGHAHPRVVQAGIAQMRLLNTNTRYLHENIVRYAERLIELLPDHLEVCYFVNSGSEANELALRLATSVAMSAHQSLLDPEDAYLTVSEASAWELLETLIAIDPATAAERIAVDDR